MDFHEATDRFPPTESLPTMTTANLVVDFTVTNKPFTITLSTYPANSKFATKRGNRIVCGTDAPVTKQQLAKAVKVIKRQLNGEILQDEAGNKVKVVAIPETYRFNSQSEDHRRFAWLNVEVKPL